MRASAVDDYVNLFKSHLSATDDLGGLDKLSNGTQTFVDAALAVGRMFIDDTMGSYESGVSISSSLQRKDIAF